MFVEEAGRGWVLSHVVRDVETKETVSVAESSSWVLSCLGFVHGRYHL